MRLIAAQRLAGLSERLERFADPLEEAAQKSGDWLTLRRLHRLMDADFSDSPLALLGDLTMEAAPPVPDDLPPPDAERRPTTAEIAAEEDTPLKDELEALGEQIQLAFEAEDPQARILQSLESLLAYGHERVSHPSDAGRLVHYASYLPYLGREDDVWRWANALASPHREDARMLSVLGALGASIRGQSDEADSESAIVTAERVDQLFRKSLQLDTSYANNFCRAGDFYMQEGNHGEAERCYSRAFRLDRVSASIAARLAELYKHTDRPREALNVLDMCLREGCQEPQISWEAGLLAFTLGKYEAALTYLDRFEAQAGEDSPVWSQYYRAVSLYELNRLPEAMLAIEEEQARADEDGFHLAAVRSCISHKLGHDERASEDLQRFLDTPLSSVDYMSPKGLEDTLLRVWHCIGADPTRREAAAVLERRLLHSGLMPDEYFDQRRQANPVESGIEFYRCLVRQPLDEHWPTSDGCLAGQDDWIHYFAEWGVLAGSEEQAADLVLQAQSRCYDGPTPEVVAVEPGEGSFDDSPGVVWQGMRFGGNDEDDDEDFDDDAEEDDDL